METLELQRRAYLRGYNAAAKDRGWISVEDKKPPSTWDEYIVLALYDHVVCGWYYEGKFRYTRPGSENIHECHPFHWMPLPPPPDVE